MEAELKISEPEFVYSEHYYRIVIEHDSMQYQWGVTVYHNPKLGFKCVNEIFRIDRNPLKNSVKKKMKKMIGTLMSLP